MFEVLIASLLFFTVLTILLPLFSLLKQEQHILHERRTVVYKLHDELQTALWNSTSNQAYSYRLPKSDTNILFTFEWSQEELIGCAQWKNVKKRQEEYCLYGMSPE